MRSWYFHCTLALTALLPQRLFAAGAVYGGDGVAAGISSASSLTGGSGDIRETVLGVVNEVLGYMAAFAVAGIIVAGFYLILGGSTDEGRDRARKIVLYVVLGLFVILLARTIVEIVINADSGGGL